MRSYINEIIIIFCFFNSCISNDLYAQYSPYFQNYSLSEYNAGNQNWDLSRGSDGKLYVANNNGLLVFDGLKWSLHGLPNKTTIRSVLAHKDRIYIGSYEEFGYWKKNKKGVLLYNSLASLINKPEFLNEEFWQILEVDDAIIFRSFENIYIYKDNKISSVKPPSTVLSCDVVNGKVYISTLNSGIFILEKNILKPFHFSPIMVDTKVVSIIDYKNGLMFLTALKGAFSIESGKLQYWNSEINKIIKEQQLNSFSRLSNGNMVFGTIKNGIYVTDALGVVLFHLNKENGLMNNTVLNQYISKNNELWIGLDNGIASVDLNSPHTFFNDVTGELGAVYDVISFKGTIYIGSNTGLFYIDNQNNLKFIEESQGQVWELKEINGQLFCGHNNGTYIVEDNSIRLISNFTGGWTIKRVPEQNNLYIQGTYAGAARFKENDKQWTAEHLGRPRIPIRFLVFDEINSAWVAHAYKGLYKVSFNPSYDSITHVEDYGTKGLNSDYNVQVYRLKSDICFKTNDGWQKYEPLLDSIVSYKFLNDSFGKDAYIISEEDSDILVIKNKDFVEFKSFNNPDYNFKLSDRYFKKRLIVGYERISKIKDSIYALNLNDGFMLINSQKFIDQAPLMEPMVETLEVDKTLLEVTHKSIEIPFNNKNVIITISSPNSRNHFFEYSIVNLDPSHWYPIERETIELSNLSDGEYQVLFRTSDASGDVSATTSINFTVLPPWYKTVKGTLFFVLIALIAIGTIFSLHKRKIKKEQRLLIRQFEEEQRFILKEKTRENEREIARLKNESLKNEITLKSKQLANTAMALIKKNDALLDLKDELQKTKSSFSNPFTFKKLLKKVDHSIGQEDEWKVFEYNFNQVHEDYFNALRSEFPVLTHKDLKLCAYIKMNLTTKEIAPLLNISIRGVETQRYRLKSKLNLESDNNLSDYLVNFK